jgi:hypothetical protein
MASKKKDLDFLTRRIFPKETISMYRESKTSMPMRWRSPATACSPCANIRRGDRVVVRTKRGEVMAKVLQRQTPKTLELASFKADQEIRSVATEDVEWIARIIWASQ